MAIAGERDPKTRSERLEKRIAARKKRKDKDAFLKSDEFDLKTQELEKRKEGFDDKIQQAKKERLDLIREAQALKNEKKVYTLEEIQGIVKRIADDFKKAGKEPPMDDLEELEKELILKNTGIRNQE